MADDYIRREDVLKGQKTGTFANGICFEAKRCVPVEYIESLESADVVQAVHARWENYSPITIKCSRCGHVIQDWRYSECKYCPNCGARMIYGKE